MIVASNSITVSNVNDGEDGVAGKDGVGIQSTTITYQGGTSGTVQPSGTWVANPPSVTAGNYLWTRTVWSYTDGTSETGYSVAKAGEKGDKGDSGTDGLPGKDGVGIKSTAVTYQSSTSGTTAPTGTWLTIPPTVAAGNFLWTRMIWTYTDGTTETGYSVGHIGADGSDGLPGKAGADGRTPYFHQAWADSSDGNTNFSTTVSLGKKYLGTYTDYVVADSTDPTKYKWTELVGAIKIGGTNLYLNSKMITDAYGRNSGATVTVENFNSTTNMWHIVAAKGSGYRVGIYIGDYAKGKIPNNSDWSYSVDVKGIGKIKELGIESGDRNPVVGTIGSEWSRISQTGHVDEPQYKTIVMYFDTTSSPLDVYIKLPKLELGNMPTAWSLAPEDNASASDLAKTNQTVQTVQTQTASNWSVLAQGLGGKSAGINVYSDGTVKIDGDHVVIASGLIVDDITGKHITGSTFGNKNGTFSIDETGNITGAIISGSEFTSSFSRQSVDAAGVQSELTTTGSGTATLGDGYLVIDGKIDDASSDESFHTEVGPSGVSNRVTAAPGVERSVSLSMGELSLYSKESDASPAYIGVLTSDKLQQINNTGNLLWSGAWKMAAATTLTVEKNINECLNGWALLWSGGDTNAPNNYNYTTTYISKGFVARHSGAGVHMDLGGTKTSDAAFKYCYFTQNTIIGNDANATGTSNNYVLREVYEW